MHIKIRMKQRTQKGNGPNFFECSATVCKILTDFEQNVELLPFSDDDIGQGIKKIEDLRRKKKLWERFAKGCKHVQKTSFVTLHIKVDMKSTLLELKRKADFFCTLRQNSVFLEQQLINSVDPIRVGGLLYSHPKFTDGIQAMYHINKGLNEGSDKPVKIQLAAHMMYVGSKGSKVFTRLLAVECDRRWGAEVKKRLQVLFTEMKMRTLDANVYNMKLIPLRPDGVTNENTLAKLVCLQQRFLENKEAVTMYG